MEASRYVIRVRGELGPEWSAWLDEAVMVEAPGTTTIVADLPDQAALHGLLARIRDLGLPLISVELVAAQPRDAQPAQH